MTRIALITFGKNGLGVRQISSYLRQNGYAVDFRFIPPEEAAGADISGLDADIVGMSVLTDHFPAARKLAARLRARFGAKRPVIIFGGPHATMRPEECLTVCDYAVKGEAEETVLEICKKFPDINSIPGVCRLEGGKYIENPPQHLAQDLDKYPVQDFKDYGDLENYNILASRGCPYSCAYCYNNYLKNLYRASGPYLRKRGVPSIIAELKKAREAFPNLKTVSFFDDTLLARSPEDLRELFGRYKEEIGLPFACLTSPSQLTEEKLLILSRGGLARIQVGIQTGSEPVNYKVYKRLIPNSRVVECAELCVKHGVKVYFDIIFNNPYETAEDVAATLDFLLGLPLPPRMLHLQGYNLVFYPGTEITDCALRDGYISEKKGPVPEGLTIQGHSNTPLFFNSSLDNPLWDIHFSPGPKEHYNTLIALTPYLDKRLIKFLIKRRAAVSALRITLKALIRMIPAALLREDSIVFRFLRKLL